MTTQPTTRKTEVFGAAGLHGDAVTRDERRWEVLRSRVPPPSTTFLYGVRTTGIFCRIGCPSRLPRRENVHFFDDARQAESAGYRACRKCHPKEAAGSDPADHLIGRVCHRLMQLSQPASIDDLALEFQMSRRQLQKRFQRVCGCTIREFVAGLRKNDLRIRLRESDSITTAMFNSAYHSSGRFYEAAQQVLGMTPSNFQAGGVRETIRFGLGRCRLGHLLVGATTRGVCWIALNDCPELLLEEFQTQFCRAELVGADPEFEDWMARVAGLVDQPAVAEAIPLDLRGTLFQLRVWNALCKIPLGTTISYSQLAENLGVPKSARAVARACATNKLAVAIPCHRVVRRDGSLSGYRWGLDRKQQLLDAEKACRASRVIPQEYPAKSL